MNDRPVYTVTSVPPVPESYEDAIQRARALKPRLAARVEESERLARLPDATVVDFMESGLLGLMKPRRYGGSELGAETMIDVTIELASADASSGWVYMLWTAHLWLQSLWPERAQDEQFENPNTVASSVVSTTGDVVAVPGGYRWTGKGLFSSGVDHCNWLTALVPIKRDGEVAERRWLLIPREDFEIVDDWNVIGLAATGSKTIVLNDVFVPEYRTVTWEETDGGSSPGAEVNDHPMYRGIVSANFTAAMAAPAIGTARGFLELFEERIAKKVTVPDKTNSPYVPEGLGTTMARYANSTALVDAVHALTLANATRYSRLPAKDATVTDRLKCTRDQTFTAQTSRRAVNALFEECGGTGLAEGSPLQRKWRDANATAAHHALTWDWQAEAWVKSRLGLLAAPPGK